MTRERDEALRTMCGILSLVLLALTLLTDDVGTGVSSLFLIIMAVRP